MPCDSAVSGQGAAARHATRSGTSRREGLSQGVIATLTSLYRRLSLCPGYNQPMASMETRPNVALPLTDEGLAKWLVPEIGSTLRGVWSTDLLCRLW